MDIPQYWPLPLWCRWKDATESNTGKDTFTRKNLSLESLNNHYSVYVIELSKAVLKEPKFVKANPNYDHNKLCLYVGATGLDVGERFSKHKAGIKSNKYVQLYGIRLLPELSKNCNNLTYEEAWAKESILAAELRKKGYAVFQA